MKKPRTGGSGAFFGSFGGNDDGEGRPIKDGYMGIAQRFSTPLQANKIRQHRQTLKLPSMRLDPTGDGLV
jgi:hypothetical protein